MNPLDLAKAVVARHREERARKQASRDAQGWCHQRRLSEIPLKHDGSTAAERAERKQPTRADLSPWVPA